MDMSKAVPVFANCDMCCKPYPVYAMCDIGDGTRRCDDCIQSMIECDDHMMEEYDQWVRRTFFAVWNCGSHLKTMQEATDGQGWREVLNVLGLSHQYAERLIAFSARTPVATDAAGEEAVQTMQTRENPS